MSMKEKKEVMLNFGDVFFPIANIVCVRKSTDEIDGRPIIDITTAHPVKTTIVFDGEHKRDTVFENCKRLVEEYYQK